MFISQEAHPWKTSIEVIEEIINLALIVYIMIWSLYMECN